MDSQHLSMSGYGMLITAETINAVVRSQASPYRQSGTGKVIITDKATWLQTSAERIPIELPQGNNLRSGQKVRYEISGEIISITPVAAQKNSAPSEAAGIFSPQQNSVATAAATSLRTGPYSAGAIPPGLYLVSKTDEAVALLGKMDDDFLLQLRKIIAEDGAAAIRIETAGTTTSRVFLLKIPEITQALQALRSSFASAALATLPVEVLTQVLFDRGNLPYPAFIELDRALQTGSAPFANTRAGSVDAQNSALAQWLHAAVSQEKMPVSAAPLAPQTPASAVMTELERFLPSISTVTGTPPADTDGFGLTRQSIKPTADGVDPITAATRRMGFTLEHTLGNNPAATKTEISERTLKGMLLELSAHPLMKNDSRAEPRPLPEAGLTTVSTKTVRNNDDDDAGASISQQRRAERINELYRDLVQYIAREVPQINRQPNTSVAENKLPAVPPPAWQQSSIAPAATGPADTHAFVNIAGRIAELLTTAGLLSALPTASANLPQQPEMSTQQQNIATLLTRLAEIADSLTRTVSGTPAPSTDLSPAIPLIRAALGTIESIVTLIQDMPETATTGTATHGHDRDRATISLPPERAQGAAPQQPGIFSRTIDTVLDRLESLQLLARQTSTTQGTQQIIALPIKFGEAWTEINVRFLHHRQRKTSKNAPHFSVFIDVAPATLGAISAHIDYRTTKQLQVNLEFERSTTRDWFAGHKGELQSDLARSAAAAVRIDLRQKRKQTMPSTTVLRSGSGTIDMTG